MKGICSQGAMLSHGATCHHDPPCPKAPAAALLPLSIHMDLVPFSRSSQGAFLLSVFPRPASHLLRPCADPLFTFWDRAYQADISLTHLRIRWPQTVHRVLLRTRHRLPGAPEGGFRRKPGRTLTLTALLSGRDRTGAAAACCSPPGAAGTLSPLDVTAGWMSPLDVIAVPRCSRSSPAALRRAAARGPRSPSRSWTKSRGEKKAF